MVEEVVSAGGSVKDVSADAQKVSDAQVDAPTKKLSELQNLEQAFLAHIKSLGVSQELDKAKERFEEAVLWVKSHIHK